MELLSNLILLSDEEILEKFKNEKTIIQIIHLARLIWQYEQNLKDSKIILNDE